MRERLSGFYPGRVVLVGGRNSDKLKDNDRSWSRKLSELFATSEPMLALPRVKSFSRRDLLDSLLRRQEEEPASFRHDRWRSSRDSTDLLALSFEEDANFAPVHRRIRKRGHVLPALDQCDQLGLCPDVISDDDADDSFFASTEMPKAPLRHSEFALAIVILDFNEGQQFVRQKMHRDNRIDL